MANAEALKFGNERAEKAHRVGKNEKIKVFHENSLLLLISKANKQPPRKDRIRPEYIKDISTIKLTTCSEKFKLKMERIDPHNRGIRPRLEKANMGLGIAFIE